MVTACAFSCNKGDEGSATVTKKTAVDETTVPENASLCKEEYLGKKPMVIAYYTENSKELPNPAYLTHINYAHGRFANPKTGDGGITVASPDLLKKVVALKSQNPDLKVLLMIGGWGERADGFSVCAADPAKRALFCSECKKHIDTYGLDGIDIDRSETQR